MATYVSCEINQQQTQTDTTANRQQIERENPKIDEVVERLRGDNPRLDDATKSVENPRIDDATKTVECEQQKLQLHAETLEIEEEEVESEDEILKYEVEITKNVIPPEEEDTDAEETIKEMIDRLSQQRKRIKRRNNQKKEANNPKNLKGNGRKSKRAKIADEENDDDDFVSPPPRELKDKRSIKIKRESQYRCGLQPIFKIIELVKEKKALSKRQFGLLKSSPFFDFFNVFYEGNIELKECKKNTENLDAVYKCFSTQEKAFIFGKDKMIITAKDISLLFGMPMIGNNIEPVQKMTSKTIPKCCRNFAYRNFGKSAYITRVLIEKRIKEEVEKKKKENEDDLPILIIMDILVTFFFPNNQQKLRWGLLQYLLDFEKMKTVSWPSTIEKNFHKFVNKFIHNPRNMSGCAMLPLYCMCEKMKLIPQRCNVKYTHPRFARWNLMELKKFMSKEFLDRIREGQVNEISDVRPHEKRLLENVDEISSRTKRAIESQKGRKRKREEHPTSVEEEVKVRILNIRIQEIEEENKRLKKDLKNERFLRKEAEGEIAKLKKELKGKKPVSTEAEIPNDDSEATEVDEHFSETKVEELKKNDPKIESNLQPLSTKSTTNTPLLLTPPNFNLNITQIINEIHAEAEEEEKKKNEKIVEPPSYVGRLKEKNRKNTRRNSYVYSIDEKPKGRKKKTVSRKGYKSTQKETEIEDKHEEKSDAVPKPLAIEEPSWQALRLSHCPCVHYLSKEQQAAVKKHFCVSISTGKDVAREDSTVLGGCMITNDMIVNILEGNLTDGQVIDWFAKNCALHPHNYSLTTMATKALVDKFKEVVNSLALPILKTVVEDNLTEEVYFPLHCNNHWTLVTLAYANMQWSHYDSNRPRRSNENNNPSLKAAMILRTEVEKVLQQLWKEQNIQDKQLSNSEMLQIDCAQQGPDTLDCGIFVMMFIISLNREKLPQNVPKKEMMKIRARLAYEICSATGYLWDLGEYMCSFHPKEVYKN